MAQGTEVNKKASNIRTMFDDIAPDYDKLNHLISLGMDRSWRKSAVKRVADIGAQDILDLAAGTGDFTIALAQVLPEARIVAADLSAGMLSEAERKFGDLGLSCVSTKVCNALDMPFDTATFDAVTCAFGVRNFSDLSQGLREMLRVLRPRGQAVILELCEPRGHLLHGLYKVYAFHVIPLMGSIVGHHRSAYSYLPKSIHNMTQREDMVTALTAAGFEQVGYKVFAPGVCAMYTAYKPL